MLRVAKQALGMEVPKSHPDLLVQHCSNCCLMHLWCCFWQVWTGGPRKAERHFSLLLLANCETTAARTGKQKSNLKNTNFTCKRIFFPEVPQCNHLYFWNAGHFSKFREPRDFFGQQQSGTQKQNCSQLPVITLTAHVGTEGFPAAKEPPQVLCWIGLLLLQWFSHFPGNTTCKWICLPLFLPKWAITQNFQSCLLIVSKKIISHLSVHFKP